jgi:hypothetical protein
MRIRSALRANPGTPTNLRPREAAWHAEYWALRTFGWTHEQYLDTPHEATQWLMRIDGVVREYEAEKKREAEQRAG